MLSDDHLFDKGAVLRLLLILFTTSTAMFAADFLVSCSFRNSFILRIWNPKMNSYVIENKISKYCRHRTKTKDAPTTIIWITNNNDVNNYNTTNKNISLMSKPIRANTLKKLLFEMKTFIVIDIVNDNAVFRFCYIFCLCCIYTFVWTTTDIHCELSLTLGLCSNGIRLANCAIVVVVVFHTNVSTSECSVTPGHGMVTFLPASAIIFSYSKFVTSVREKKKIRNLILFFLEKFYISMHN